MPTLKESGIDVDANLWTGLFAPAATPAPIINKLNAEITRYLNEPQTANWLTHNLGGEFAAHTPDQYRNFLARDLTGWLKVIKQNDLQLD